MGLKWQDIDFNTSALQVRRIQTRVPSKMEGKGFVESELKTKKSRRSVVIASFALKALQEHRWRQLDAIKKAGLLWQHHDYVFYTSIGTPINPTTDMLEPLNELLEQAGLPYIRFHDLRHSAASLLMNQGVHSKVVQELLGHGTIGMMIDVYSHVLPSMR